MSVPVTVKLNSLSNPEKKSEIFKSGAFLCKLVVGIATIDELCQYAKGMIEEPKVYS